MRQLSVNTGTFASRFLLFLVTVLTGQTLLALPNLCQKFYSYKVEAEADFRKMVASEIRADKKNLKRMEQETADLFIELRKKAIDLKNAEGDFTYEPHRPILSRIAKDMRLRKQRKFGDQLSERLEDIAKQADELLANGAPYKATIKFIMYKYLPMLDSILALRHPGLIANNHHRHRSEHRLLETLDLAPDLFLIFSFEEVNTKFFVNSRSAPIQLIGLDLRGLDDALDVRPYADNFYMKNSEFSWHDLDHVDFMARKDLTYVLSDTKDLERVVWEWTFTKNRIAKVISETNKKDPILAMAMDELLNELLHERGFQYSLTVLKQELETPQWVEVMERKRDNHFYDKGGFDFRVFPKLDAARLALLKAVHKFRDQDQINWIQALHGKQVPVKIAYSAPLGISHGTLNSVEITSANSINFVGKSTSGNLERTPMKEVVVAQVNRTQKSTLNKATVHAIGHLLAAIEQRTSIQSLNFGNVIPARVIIQRTHEISIVTEDGVVIPLHHLTLSQGKPLEKYVMPNPEVFEIEQVLGSADRQEILAYALRQAPVVYRSKTVLHKNPDGTHMVEFLDSEGTSIKRPLVDVRIDPLGS